MAKMDVEDECIQKCTGVEVAGHRGVEMS